MHSYCATLISNYLGYIFFRMTQKIGGINFAILWFLSKLRQNLQKMKIDGIILAHIFIYCIISIAKSIIIRMHLLLSKCYFPVPSVSRGFSRFVFIHNMKVYCNASELYKTCLIYHERANKNSQIPYLKRTFVKVVRTVYTTNEHYFELYLILWIMKINVIFLLLFKEECSQIQIPHYVRPPTKGTFGRCMFCFCFFTLFF